MGLLDKAKEAAEQARQSIEQTVDQARGPSEAPPVPAAEGVEDQVAAGMGGDTAESPPPAAPAKTGSGIDDLKAQMMKAARRSKDSLATLVEKIDPGVLADLIIKATAAQEKANIALAQKRSPYRIAEINITATIPPQIGFSVQRMGDMEELDDPSSLELIEEGEVEADPVVSLAGDNPIEEEIGE